MTDDEAARRTNAAFQGHHDRLKAARDRFGGDLGPAFESVKDRSIAQLKRELEPIVDFWAEQDAQAVLFRRPEVRSFQ